MSALGPFLAGDRPADRGTPVPIDAQTTPRKLVLRTMWGAKKYTIPAMVLMILHFVGEAMVPVIMGLAIDRAVLPHDGDALLIWLAILAADFVLLSVTWRFGIRLTIYGRNQIEHQFRMRVTDRILDPAGSDGPARLPGTALAIATSDVARLAAAVMLAVLPVGELASVIVAGLILLWLSWPLGVAVLVGAPILFWIVDRAGAPLRARTEAQQESVGVAAGTAADLVAGFRVLKGLGAEEEAAQRYRKVSGRARDAAIAAMRAEGGYVTLLQATTALFVIAIGAAAAVLAVNGALGLGALITVVGLTQYIMGPLGAVGTNFGTVWNAAVPSAGRVVSVLQAGPAVRSGALTAAVSGPVVITGLTGVDGAARAITVPARGLTVIVTDQHTGRLLAALLAREERPAGVHVRVGDDDLFALDRQTGRTAVRVVPHSPHLFEGSVLDNISAGMGERTDDGRVARAVFAAACDDVAQVLPNGLATPVGEAGRMLSGGQRQRVGLARALAAPSGLLVLSDPTTAVDSVTEGTVAERVAQARAEAATLVFTQAPAWIAVADTVIRLDRVLDDDLQGVSR